MNCSKCGTFNNSGSKFCIGCGSSLETETINYGGNQNSGSIHQPTSFVQPETISQPQFQQSSSFVQPESLSPQEPVANDEITQHSININNNSMSSNIKIAPNDGKNIKVSFMGYFFIILAVLLKPFTSLKEELNKFEGFKNSAILSLIISGSATIINLLTTMFNAVRVKSFSWTTGKVETTWVWENLKNLKYVEIIGKNFLIYLGVMVAIAAVYYLASLIVKKQVKFSRLLAISALSTTPLMISMLVLSPILSIIYADLGILIIIIGLVYTLVMLYDGINSELALKGNVRYYLNLICLSLLGIVGYYLMIKLVMNSITGGLGNIMDFFG